MSKIYSIILLLTFLVGALQPIMPMLKYQLFVGDVIELIAGEDCPQEEYCEMDQCYPDADCPSCNDDKKLIDANFYPLALKISRSLAPLVFRTTFNISHLFKADNLNPVYTPNPPPPKSLKEA